MMIPRIRAIRARACETDCDYSREITWLADEIDRLRANEQAVLEKWKAALAEIERLQEREEMLEAHANNLQGEIDTLNAQADVLEI